MSRSTVTCGMTLSQLDTERISSVRSGLFACRSFSAILVGSPEPCLFNATCVN